MKEVVITIQTQTNDLVNFVSSDIIEMRRSSVTSEKTHICLIKNGHNHVLGVYQNWKQAIGAVDDIRLAIQNRCRTYRMKGCI